jgi:glutamate/tyrosine decarboxylase-like PLP-dependent enzyme
MQFNKQINNKLLALLAEQFSDFRDALATSSVAKTNATATPITLPEEYQGIDAMYQHLQKNIVNGLSGSNGGRYWGFVTGGANPAATLADWLVTVFNQNVSKGGDSIASQVEAQTITALCDLFYLPHHFKGLFTTGATSANLLGAMTARQFAGAQQNMNVARHGMANLEVAIFSATPHASMVKSLGMAGFGQQSWHAVATLTNSEAMCVKTLSEQLANNTSKSKIVIASAATVTGTDYDDIEAISRLCKQHNAWLHVDAAFGIFERLLNGPHGKTNGLERADSITLDCHKWLNVPYDCGVFLTQQPNYLVDTFNVDAPYLANTGNETPFMSMGIENSRRFRALPVWATLMSYGREGISQAINSNITHAQQLASWINDSADYVLLKPCELNVVLFAPANMHKIPQANACLAAINNTGTVFMSPGQWQGNQAIRAAFSNWQTTDEDVALAINTLQAIAKSETNDDLDQTIAY